MKETKLQLTQRMLKIKTTPDKYFHQVLSIIREVPPYKTLSTTELQVLGELMKLNYQGYKPIITTSTRKLIMQVINLHPQTLSNAINSLRKKEFIVNDELSEKLIIKYLQDFNFEFYED